MIEEQELIINDDNFKEYFFDIRKNSPKKGQIIATYTAKAQLTDGFIKRNLIELLKKDGTASSAAQVMQKLAWALEGDSYRICKEIAEDLLNGLTSDEIADKPYFYTLQARYYANPDVIPANDPHWSFVKLFWANNNELEVTEHLNGKVLKSNIKFPPKGINSIMDENDFERMCKIWDEVKDTEEFAVAPVVHIPKKDYFDPAIDDYFDAEAVFQDEEAKFQEDILNEKKQYEANPIDPLTVGDDRNYKPTPNFSDGKGLYKLDTLWRQLYETECEMIKAEALGDDKKGSALKAAVDKLKEDLHELTDLISADHLKPDQYIPKTKKS